MAKRAARAWSTFPPAFCNSSRTWCRGKPYSVSLAISLSGKLGGFGLFGAAVADDLDVDGPWMLAEAKR